MRVMPSMQNTSEEEEKLTAGEIKLTVTEQIIDHTGRLIVVTRTDVNDPALHTQQHVPEDSNSWETRTENRVSDLEGSTQETRTRHRRDKRNRIIQNERKDSAGLNDLFRDVGRQIRK